MSHKAGFWIHKLGPNPALRQNPRNNLNSGAGERTIRRPSLFLQMLRLSDTALLGAAPNHSNFTLPNAVEAGVPGSFIPTDFGTLESTISRPALLGVGLGGDSSPRMIAFQGRI